MGFLERSDALRGARAILDAEKLFFHPLGRHGGGAQDDERAVRALGHVMQAARSKLLARTHGAGDQDAAVGGRDLLERLAQLPHGHGCPKQFDIGTGAALERLILAPKPRCLQRAADDQDEPVGIERLFDVLIGAALDGRDRRLDIAVTGNDDDRQSRDAARV